MIFAFEFQFLCFVAFHPIGPFFQLGTPWYFPFNYMHSLLRIGRLCNWKTFLHNYPVLQDFVNLHANIIHLFSKTAHIHSMYSSNFLLKDERSEDEAAIINQLFQLYWMDQLTAHPSLPKAKI